MNKFFYKNGHEIIFFKFEKIQGTFTPEATICRGAILEKKPSFEVKKNFEFFISLKIKIPLFNLQIFKGKNLSFLSCPKFSKHMSLESI